jgi:glycosyltransferase involved in cell wall biosynthesis
MQRVEHSNRLKTIQKPLRSASTKESVTYSIVAPVFNEEETLPHFYERVVAAMSEYLQTHRKQAASSTPSEPDEQQDSVYQEKSEPSDDLMQEETFELLFVNDGSRDGSFHIMQELHEKDPRVRVINFSRNFGHQIAISAGLDYARGQAVIILDADLQDPPEVIPTMIERWKHGAEVVYAQRTHREGETPFKLLTAAAFYRLIERITAISIPRDTGDFRLLDRRVVDVLITMREQHRFMRGLSVWVGFRQEAVAYERQERFAGTTKYPLNKMIRFSLDAITSFSHVPLQLATSFGFLLAGLSLIGIIIAIFLRLFTGQIVGQASTLILVLFLGGIQLIFLGIIGEYLGRIYDEVRARPLYIVHEVLD